jgi:3-hydroxyacyl-[acyl-carrier-protein] dehydratase
LTGKGQRGKRLTILEDEMDQPAGRTLEALDIQRLLSLLPHRYPFLLVDRIIEAVGDESCIGIKNVSVNEPHFMGHFPGNPVMPGVLVIEAMAQTAGALVSARHGGQAKSPQVMLTGIDKAKFRKPVVPGDQLRLHMTRIAQRRNIWWFKGEARVDGVLVCEAEVSALMVLS